MTSAELRALAEKHLGHKLLSEEAKDWMAVNTRMVLALLDVVGAAKAVVDDDSDINGQTRCVPSWKLDELEAAMARLEGK